MEQSDENRPHFFAKNSCVRGKRNILFQAPTLFLFLLLSILPHIAEGGREPEKANVNYNANNSPAPSAGTSILEIYENESFDPVRSIWHGESNRWTTSTGSASDPPTSLLPPPQYTFTSDWKIDVTGKGTRDKEGWEYFLGGKRRRRWLRTLTPLPDQQSIPNLESMDKKLKSRTKKLKRNEWFLAQRKSEKMERTPGMKRPRILPQFHLKSLLSPLINDYNFKGYGLSIYKSIIFPTSYGALFRIPLSANFDFCETRPHIPYLSSSTGFFGSHDNFTIVTHLSLSLPMEVLRYIVAKIAKIIYLIYWLILRKMVWGTIQFIYSLLIRLSTSSSSKEKQEKEPSTVQTITSILASRSIKYSADYQERVGFSLSWRISKKRGYEFRISYSHLYLPTLESLILRNRNGKISSWLKEKTGSLGISSGYPIPDFPPFSSSCVLSLSGFYPRFSFKNVSSNEEIEVQNTAQKEGKNNLEQKMEASSVSTGKEALSKDLMREEDATSSSPAQRDKIVDNNEDDEKKLISSSFGWGSSNV